LSDQKGSIPSEFRRRSACLHSQLLPPESLTGFAFVDLSLETGSGKQRPGAMGLESLTAAKGGCEIGAGSAR